LYRQHVPQLVQPMTKTHHWEGNMQAAAASSKSNPPGHQSPKLPGLQSPPLHEHAGQNPEKSMAVES
jgi:hypothetical protein